MSYVHRASSVAAANYGLTPLQLELLQALADGETLTEYARRTGRKTSSVRTRANLARRNLGARNRTHAVAAAVRKGLIW